MRKIYFLRTVLDFLLYFSILGGITLLIMIPLILTDSNWNIPFKINGIITNVDSTESKITFVITIISYFMFVYAIYLFKKIVNLFINRKIFDNKVISYLNRVGKIFIIVTIVLNVIELVFNVTNRNTTVVTISSGFDSFLFTVSIGLFFIILSEVFKIAKRMKEENELTI